MRGSVVEPICLRAVGAVNDTGGTRVLDPRNSLLILRRDHVKTTETSKEEYQQGRQSEEEQY